MIQLTSTNCSVSGQEKMNVVKNHKSDILILPESDTMFPCTNQFLLEPFQRHKKILACIF